jgi:predicted secreted protein
MANTREPFAVSVTRERGVCPYPVRTPYVGASGPAEWSLRTTGTGRVIVDLFVDPQRVIS